VLGFDDRWRSIGTDFDTEPAAGAYIFVYHSNNRFNLGLTLGKKTQDPRGRCISLRHRVRYVFRRFTTTRYKYAIGHSGHRIKLDVFLKEETVCTS
jgi:flavin-dependent dehydrogenase